MKNISEQTKVEHVCISWSNRILTSTTGWSRLTQAEQHVLTLIIGVRDCNDDLLPTIRDVPIYLDSINRTQIYRLVSIRLVDRLHVSIICLDSPKINDFENIIERIFLPQREHIHNLNSLIRKNSFYDKIISFDPNIQSILYINRETRFCVSSLEPTNNVTPLSIKSKRQRYETLRQFYIEIVRVEKEKSLPFEKINVETQLNEMYFICHEEEIPHKCYFLREQDSFEVYIVFDQKMPTVAMRGIARKTLTLLKKHL